MLRTSRRLAIPVCVLLASPAFGIDLASLNAATLGFTYGDFDDPTNVLEPLLMQDGLIKLDVFTDFDSGGDLFGGFGGGINANFSTANT